MKHLAVAFFIGTFATAHPSPAQSVTALAPSRADEIRDLRQELRRINARLNFLPYYQTSLRANYAFTQKV